MVFAIPTPRTEAVDQRPPGPTHFSTHTPKHRHFIHNNEPQSTAAAATAFPRRNRPTPPITAISFEGSGSGEPSGDDQAEEEEEQEEPDEEAGSGIPKESSGADDPIGKSLLFHFITHDALTACVSRGVEVVGFHGLQPFSEPYHNHVIICSNWKVSLFVLLFFIIIMIIIILCRKHRCSSNSCVFFSSPSHALSTRTRVFLKPNFCDFWLHKKKKSLSTPTGVIKTISIHNVAHMPKQ